MKNTAYLVMVLMVCGLAAVSRAAAAELTAGVAVVDITPPVGYRMAGYFNERLATETSDPLRAKAIVLRQGDQRVAMVFCDLLGIAPEVSSTARNEAAKKTGIAARSIVIAATHSHTGPMYWDAMRTHYHQRALDEQGKDPHETVDYAAELAGKIVSAMAAAAARSRPANLSAASVEERGLSFNRRFHMKDGSVRFNPGVLNPQIVRAAGPIDPQVGIVMVRDAADGSALAAVVNFALHLDTTGGTMYSADYPFYAERALREDLGNQFTLFFGTGACGDINHLDVTTKERRNAEQIGKTLAAAVKRGLPTLGNIAEPSLAMRSQIIRAPLQKYGPEKIAWAKENIANVGTGRLPFLQEVEAYKILSLQDRGGDTIALEVQVVRLSRDVAIVCLPGEVFSELGLAIKKASPFKTTLVVELCNDDPDYIPTNKAFGEGSYETVNSRIAPGGGERMAQTAIDLLRELAGGK